MKRIIAVAIVLVACGKEKVNQDEPPAPASSTVEPKPEPPKKKAETTAAAFGKTPAAPFGKIAKLQLGMSEADARAAGPEFFTASGPQTVTDEDAALSFTPVIRFGRLWKIEIKSTSLDSMERLVPEAWGPGIKAKGTIGEVIYWFDPANHTRAVADSRDLDLDYYLPLEQLLGEAGKVDLAALPEPVIGISADALRASYGAQMKPDDKLLHIYLPPTEYERDHVSVFVIHSERKKKTVDYSIELGTEATPTTKDEMLAAFKKKWGEPKVKKSYGSSDDDLIFHAKNPLIQVHEGPHKKSWKILVRQKDDACGGPCFKGL